MPTHHPATRRLLVGALLVFVGLLAWALCAKQANSERHSYSNGSAPPAYVRLSAGDTYEVAIPGGVQRELKQGLDPTKLSCTAARPGQAPGKLAVTAEDSGTKATDTIGSFISGIRGLAQIRCDGIGAVYIDNADDAGFDYSGFWLVVTSLALLVGFGVLLSALRAITARPAVSGDDVPRVDPAAEELL